MSNPENLLKCCTIPPLGNSDHQGISVSVKWNVSSKKLITKSRLIWRYKYADFTEACNLLEQINWDDIFANCSNVNAAVEMFQTHFLHIMSLTIPRSNIREKHNIPWLSKDIIQAMRKRNNLYKKLKRSNNDYLSKAYLKSRNRVVAMLRSAKNKYFRSLCGASSSDFWKSVKFLNKNSITIPSLTLPNGDVAMAPAAKANALNVFFASCFNQSCSPLSVHVLVKQRSEGSMEYTRGQSN